MKKSMLLSGRLALCASYVAENSRLADIGTDHAYLPIALALENRISYAVACDIAEGPLERAKENIRKYDLEDKIQTRLSDGLVNVSREEIDTVIIVGLPLQQGQGPYADSPADDALRKAHFMVI